MVWVILSFLLQVNYGCNVDSEKLNAALSDLESKGYTIETGNLTFLKNSSSLPFGANPNGLYGEYIIDFFGINKAPFWYVPGESAIIFHGCSPPNSAYFSYRSYIGTEGEVIHPFPLTFASLGDSINQLVLNYTNTNHQPFDSLMTMITTPDQITYKDIYNSFQTVGLQHTLNLDIIPTTVEDKTFIFGKNPEKSNIFTFTVRITIPFDIEAYNKYINQKYQIYMISTSKNVLDRINQFSPRKPYQSPIFRNRTSNINEYNLYINSIQELTESVTNYFMNKQLTLTYNTSIKPYEIDGYECIEDNTACLGDNHDAAYYTTNTTFKSEDFLMRSNKLYIVLGVNHNTINQTVYSNIGVYKVGIPLLSASNGSDSFLYADIGGITNYDIGFIDSAIYFDVNSNITNIDKLFVVGISRPETCHLYLNTENVPCLAFNESIIGNDDPFGFVARAYLNPNTKTGPSYQQIIQDVVLEFTVGA